jgi:SAM-dependent methyltransferase/ribosomal protein S18 acetylase RimI-like enzyme
MIREIGEVVMAEFASRRARDFFAKTYDQAVSDWPSEIEFYRDLALQADARGQAVLELACGTGRVAIRLAQSGATVVGLDHSKSMLQVARQRGRNQENVSWVQDDIRAFDLGQEFGLIILAGHSFQNLLTSDDQVACLRCAYQHLAPGAVLVVHLDNPEADWLSSLVGASGGQFEPAESFVHPETGREIRVQRAWSYEPAEQTAISETTWEELDGSGAVLDRWESGALRFRVVGRFEMEHALARAGFEVEALYGSFARDRFGDDSQEMVFVARARDQVLPSPMISVERLSDASRSWAEQLLRERWGSTLVVSRYRMHQADQLDGFVACVDGQPQGLVTYRIERGQCELVSLDSLAPELGVGTALVEAVANAALAAGCYRVWLITTNDNTQAMHFYQRRGFDMVAVHRYAVRASRELKPGIPETGIDGIPIRHEVELELEV